MASKNAQIAKEGADALSVFFVLLGFSEVDAPGPENGAFHSCLPETTCNCDGGAYNQSKAMTAALEYAPYGEPRAWRGDAPAPTYTGHYRDAESGLYFAPYRYYLSDAGRWLTRDPLGMVDGPNVYGYVGGRPGMEVDPLGLLTCNWKRLGQCLAIRGILLCMPYIPCIQTCCALCLLLPFWGNPACWCCGGCIAGVAFLLGSCVAENCY
jgi:RHS repeat-associated protein